MLPAQGPRCTKCGRLTKGYALPYGVNCTPAPIEDSMNDSRDILSSRVDALEVPCLHSHSILGKPEDPTAESAALGMVVYPSEQGPVALPPRVPAIMASPAATTPTITMASIPSEVLTEDSQAVLSTRLGQQGKERAKDRCCIGELSQQLTETNDQIAYIKKVLDCLISGQTLAPTAAAVTPASSTAPGPAPPSDSGCLPLGQATSLLGIRTPKVSQASLFIAQSSTASGSAHPSISGNHFCRQAASATHTGFLQASQDFQDHAQTVAFQGHPNNTLFNHSPRLVFSSDLLTWFPLGKGTPALGQPLRFHQHQQLQAAIATGLPGTPQHSTTDNNTFGRCNSSGLTNLSAPLPVYSAQTAINTPSMVTDIATVAKVIPMYHWNSNRRLYRVSL